MTYNAATFYLDLVNGSDTARSALATVTVSNPSGTITRCNKTAHGLVTGAVVDLTLFTAWLNDAWKITVFDADNFDLDGAVWQATADASGTATPRGGANKADAWKTLLSGATAARIAPNDTIRLMATGYPSSLGINATWTQGSKTVTLASSLTQMVSDCESAWTGSANVTTTADTSNYKEGTKSAKHVIASGFTTGKVAYFATGTLNLSGYQQISFWFQNNAAVASGSVLSLRLCSDTIGAVSVQTIAIPAIPSTTNWIPITVDIGSALPSAVESIALYADSDPGTITVQLDDIIACKASSSADSLTLSSLIGKVWNLSWEASTAYASNDIRKPTQPNRNGYRYKVTAGGGGSSGGSEPTWPTEIGTTVTDGALTWTCEGYEDTWFGIQSINGTTVKLDNHVNALATEGRGYAGATETVAAYKRECVTLTMATNATGDIMTVTDSGTDGLPITFSGGWNTTDMTTQDGETWVDGRNGFGEIIDASATFIHLINLNGVRADKGIRAGNGSNYGVYRNCHFNNMSSHGFQILSNTVWCNGCNSSNCGTNGYDFSFATVIGPATLQAITSNSHNSVSNSGVRGNAGLTVRNAELKNGAGYGLTTISGGEYVLRNVVTGNNSLGGITNPASAVILKILMYNCLIPESTEFSSGLIAKAGSYYHSMRHDQTADNHLLWSDGGSIISATDQRNTASGISWKFRPTNVIRSESYPLKLLIATIAVSANNLVTMSIACRRDSTNIQGKLIVQGAQIAGVPEDVSVSLAPSVNTWASSSNLTFTPTEAGTVQVYVYVWDGVGTSNNLWVDDFVVAQA